MEEDYYPDEEGIDNQPDENYEEEATAEDIEAQAKLDLLSDEEVQARWDATVHPIDKYKDMYDEDILELYNNLHPRDRPSMYPIMDERHLVIKQEQCMGCKDRFDEDHVCNC